MDELRSNLADILEFRIQLTYRISALLAQFGGAVTVSDIERLIFEEDPSRHPSEYFADMLTLFEECWMSHAGGCLCAIGHRTLSRPEIWMGSTNASSDFVMIPTRRSSSATASESASHARWASPARQIAVRRLLERR